MNEEALKKELESKIGALAVRVRILEGLVARVQALEDTQVRWDAAKEKLNSVLAAFGAPGPSASEEK